jgi:hypothetical protein
MGHDDTAPVVIGDDWAVAVRLLIVPPTSDDVTVTLDGRRLDTKEKVLEWLAEVEADRASGAPVIPDFPR